MQVALRVNGPNLRALRELRGWSLTDLAQVSQVSVSHLSRVERGHRDLSRVSIDLIATALGIPSEILLTVKYEKESAVG